MTALDLLEKGFKKTCPSCLKLLQVAPIRRPNAKFMGRLSDAGPKLAGPDKLSSTVLWRQYHGPYSQHKRSLAEHSA